MKGQLFVDQFCEKQQYSFLDYISNGFELNFMVVVDFTGKLFHILEELHSFILYVWIFLVLFFLGLNVSADDLFIL